MSAEMHEQLLEEVRETSSARLKESSADGYYHFLVPESLSKMLTNLYFLLSKDDMFYQKFIVLALFMGVLLFLFVFSGFVVFDLWIKGGEKLEGVESHVARMTQEQEF